MSKLQDLITKFRADIPQFVSTDVVDIDAGMSIGGGSIDPNFDASVASASYAEVVKANAQALDLLGLGASSTEDILITTRDVYLLIRMLGKKHYHGLAITKQGTLGYARAIMKKYEPLLLAAVRDLE